MQIKGRQRIRCQDKINLYSYKDRVEDCYIAPVCHSHPDCSVSRDLGVLTRLLTSFVGSVNPCIWPFDQKSRFSCNKIN